MDQRTATTRLLDAAEELFYARGVQAVGMDEIRAASGVSLKRLYSASPRRNSSSSATCGAATGGGATPSPAPSPPAPEAPNRCSPSSTGCTSGSPKRVSTAARS
ncbi:hypothetical protein GCM10020366_02110 [Saccharopolyspora gregorii]|uniref:HTH tetR-type domain-containing protein n=1 Tax=Saccharopolyspora gregorii TaxID=33914 RepID=A0ABP6RNL7_9PSEU